MPALGGTSDNNSHGNRSRGGNNAASAYPLPSTRFVMFRIISLMLTFAIIRNMMTKVRCQIHTLNLIKNHVLKASVNFIVIKNKQTKQKGLSIR